MNKIPLMSAEATFADRLAVLIGDSSVSAFARKVGLGEGLIRRYLQGSEPGLSKAERISKATNCSLEWLATGAGFRFQSAEGVDMAALEGAIKLASQVIGAVNLAVNLGKSMKLVVASYQYLRATKRPDGSFDEAAGLDFTNYVADMCGLRPETAVLAE
ncbi:MAG: helix-turn-helix transcriptional regulator [Pseudomonadota bacterium]